MHIIDEIDIIKLNIEDNLLLNFITGAADIINNTIAEALTNKTIDALDIETIDTLVTRKYIFPNKDEKIKFLNSIYTELLETDKLQLPNFLIVPTYDCNLKCIYCFEQEYIHTKAKEININSENWIDNCFKSIIKIINNYEKETNQTVNYNNIFITLMGGEPLLKQNITTIKTILTKIKKYNFKYNIITNGFELEYFLNLLKSTNIHSIQVTVDGPQPIHDTRRLDKKGNGSYEKIISNIKQCIDSNIKVFLRVNIDEHNIESLPELAKELIERIGVTDLLVPYIYLLQDGGCSGDKNIIDEIECINKILCLEQKEPIIKLFKKQFHGQDFVNSILDDSKMNFKMKNCSACNNQYILDFKGIIYKCWFGIGNSNFKVGSYSNELNLDHNLVCKWKNRNILTLPKCVDCKYRLICGGGCASHIIQNGIDINKEKCTDFKKVIGTLLSKTLST